METSKDHKRLSSGNALFAVFAAIALVGLVGASVTTFLKGPLTTAVRQTRLQGAKTQMQIAAQVAVMAAATGTAPSQAKVFVTSTAQSGALGGLSGADNKCQTRAAAAGLSGTYKAWLSDSTSSPSTRFTQSTVPYKLVNGTTIANNWADLTDGTISAAINFDETGATPATGNGSITNTNTNGTILSTTNTCSDYTVSNGTAIQAGDKRNANSTWTNSVSFICSNATRLYCFEQPASSNASTNDCDGDGTIEPLEYKNVTPAPTGGGQLPSQIGVTQKDPWGTSYGYCVWDQGTTRLNAACQQTTPGTDLRLAGSATDQSVPVVAIISAGPDRNFTTTCRSYAAADVNSNGSLSDSGDLPLIGKAAAQDDDIVFSYTYTQAIAASGGLWSLKSANSAAAIIGKNIESQAAKFTGAGLFQKIAAITGDFVEAVSGLRLASPAAVSTCDSSALYIVRRNASSNAMEMCNGTAWTSMAGSGGSYTADVVPQTYNRVFATSLLTNGNIGGVSGGDAFCQRAANTAGLPGQYMAWLADSSGSPSTKFYQSTVPYKLVNGTTIANNWTDLIDGTLAAPINKNEFGGVASGRTWTGTNTNGTARQGCISWSDTASAGGGAVGETGYSDASWANTGGDVCAYLFHLYCFQQTEGQTSPTTSGTGGGTIDALSDAITDYPNYNLFMGVNTGSGTVTGTNNVAFGGDAFHPVAGMSGNYNVVFGASTLPVITTGGGNTALGAQNMTTLTTGGANTSAGYQAANNIGTGPSGNVAIGASSLHAASPPVSNATAVGYDAGNSGSGIVAFGVSALTANTANYTVGLGYQALQSLTTGGAGTPGPNTAVGYQAGKSATTASGMTAIGNTAASTTNGDSNTAIGSYALNGQGNFAQNTGVGYAAGRYATGAGITAVGYQSLMGVVISSTANNNTAAGSLALTTDTSGAENTAAGYAALQANMFGSYNTATGYAALAASQNVSANTAVGAYSLNSLTSGTGNVGFGASSLKGLVSGAGNTAIGYNAGLGVKNTSGHTLIGSEAQSADPLGDGITAIGYSALKYNAGLKNTAIGALALLNNISGGSNTGIGYNALAGITTITPPGSYNTAIGSEAMRDTAAGNGNTAIGNKTLLAVRGSYNTAIGRNAGLNLATTSYNTAIGDNALAAATADSINTAVGYQALMVNTFGTGNTAVGYNAMAANINGNFSTALGYQGLAANTYGSHNTAIGDSALAANTVGEGNTAIGNATLAVNNGTFVAADCTGLGSSQVNDATTGHCYFKINSTMNWTAAQTNCNTVSPGAYLAVPANASEYAKIVAAALSNRAWLGGNDTLVAGEWRWKQGDLDGVQFWSGGSGGSTSNGMYTSWSSANPPSTSRCMSVDSAAPYTMVGSLCSSSITSVCEKDPVSIQASYNTAIGNKALTANTTGSRNTAVGAEALKNNTTGSDNTAFGYQSLINNTTGSQNTAFGALAGPTTAGLSNTTALGYNAQVTASNAIRVGDTNITVIEGQVAFTATSDARVKKDIDVSDLGLDFIMGLKPVRYRLKQGNGRLDYGFLAQDIEASLDGRITNMITRRNDAMHTYQLRSSDLIAPLVRAMQEQEAIIEKLQAKIDAIKQARISCNESNPGGVE